MVEETEIPLANRIKSVLSKVKFIAKNLVLYTHRDQEMHESSAWFWFVPKPHKSSFLISESLTLNWTYICGFAEDGMRMELLYVFAKYYQ